MAGVQTKEWPATVAAVRAGGKPSLSSIIRYVIPDGLTYETRVGIIKKISELWVQQTGCDGNDVVVTT